MTQRIIDIRNGTIVLQLTDAAGRRYQHSYYGQAKQLADDIRVALEGEVDLSAWEGDETEEEGWQEVEPYTRAYELAELVALSDDEVERISSAALRDLVTALRPAVDV